MSRRLPRLAVAAVVGAAFVGGLPGPAVRAGEPSPDGAAAGAATDDLGVPDIRYSKLLLSNGLTLIVHEDHRAPIVATMVWYHVGSKNERPGRTGFAHLFEHLMFNGSEHANTDWFRAVGDLGATSMNGTTNLDRTNYFQTVPVGALDRVLWLESDRMGHLLGAIDQAKLDEQRGVVQNEKRQGENRPYAAADYLLPALTYPQGHPYSWTTIGSMEDLNAASLDDVREWFRAYYGPANATLVLCGDVTAAEALKKVQHYFGDIPPGPPVARPVRWIAKRTGTQRVSVEERVPAARLQFVWNTPGWGETDSHLLDLAASVLGRGEGSRLYERLVRKEALATDVSAEQDENEIAGQFSVTATAALGADLMKLEAVLREEVTRFVDFGPTAEELAIEKTKTRAGFLRRVERLGGFGGRTDLLASSQVFGGRPDAWKGRLATMFGATPERVQQAASRWLADGVLVVETRPVLRWKAAKEGADRSSMPPVAAPADPKFPEVTKATLPNGLRIVVARRAESPLVRLDLLVDAGFAADPADAPGTARLAGSLLTDGTASKNALELRRAIDSLGAELNVTTATDTTQLTLSGLRASLGPSLKLLADVALHPAFPADALETRRRAQLAEVEREGVDARGMVQRVLPRLLYGEGHPYAQPGSGTGTRDAVKKLSRDDLAKFHGAWFRPGSTTLVATGDLTAADLAPLAASAFAGWEAGAAPAKSLPAPGAGGSKSASRVFLLDRPGAPQSVVLAAQLVPARGGPEETPLEIVHTVLGGSFISRINMNLREDKHWSYGARSDIRDTRGLRVLSVSAGVQTDKTAESLAEVVKEVRRISGTEPPTADEIAMAKSQMTLTLPGRWESSRSVAESLTEMVVFGLPDGWFDGYAARVRAVTPEQVSAATKQIRPESVVWVVVGDRKRVEAGVRALGVGEVTVIDADGKPAE